MRRSRSSLNGRVGSSRSSGRGSATSVIGITSEEASMAASRSVLVLNAGSSSLKWVVLGAQDEAIVQQGDAHWEGAEGGRHERELAAALAEVRSVDAIGHRVVHGG